MFANANLAKPENVGRNFMNDISFDKRQIELLKEIVDLDMVEIIWDLNAFYFNTDFKTYKLECFDARPLGSNFEYDEICYCVFVELDKRVEFTLTDTKHCYKIFSSNYRITSLEWLNVIEHFPENRLIATENQIAYQNGLNKSTLGLIIQTDSGFLPAFLLPSNFGFHWQPKFDFYSRTEIDELLSENIEHYEIKSFV